MNRDVVFMFATRMFVVFCGIVSSIVTARLLGDNGCGEYFTVITFATVIVQFGNLGLHSSNTYLAARDGTLVRGLTANSLWLSLTAGLVGCVLLALKPLLGWPAADRAHQFWLGAALVPPILYSLLAGSLLVAEHRFKAFNLYQAASNLLLLATICAAGWWRASVSTVLAASVGAWWCCAAALHALVARSGQGPWRFRPELLQASVGFAGRAYVTCLVGYLLTRANVLLLDQLPTQVQTGYYSIAVRVADAMWILPTSVGIVLFPKLVRQQSSQWATSWRLLVRVGVLMAAACLACAALIRPFVGLAFGPQFLPAVPVVYWMLPGIFCYALVSIVSQYLAAIGFPAAVIGIWLAALGVLYAISSSLIPLHGAAGAAIALSAANATVLALQLALIVWMHAGRGLASLSAESAAAS